jgi:hypothetical protein
VYRQQKQKQNQQTGLLDGCDGVASEGWFNKNQRVSVSEVSTKKAVTFWWLSSSSHAGMGHLMTELLKAWPLL